MKLGSETNSAINHLMSSRYVNPIVGDGATILLWTDRHAATIVKVTRTQIHVQRDKATRIDSNGMSESQQYSYEPDTAAPVQVFRLTKSGYRQGSLALVVGVRKEYLDYSF